MCDPLQSATRPGQGAVNAVSMSRDGAAMRPCGCFDFVLQIQCFKSVVKKAPLSFGSNPHLREGNKEKYIPAPSLKSREKAEHE